AGRVGRRTVAHQSGIDPTRRSPDTMTSDHVQGYIGQSVPRANARRLLEGRGTYVDDLRLPRLAHVAFFRSPHAHARIAHLDLDAARAMPGVVAVVDG